MPGTTEDLDLLIAKPETRSKPPARPARAKRREKIQFFGGLARLIAGGVPLLKALGLSARHVSRPGFGEAVAGMARQVREGETLSRAMALSPAGFGPFEIAMAKAGEMSGSLPETLRRAADELNREEEIEGKVREAAAYPAFVLGMGILTLNAVLIFVIPRLSLVYRELGGRLPLATRVVMAASEAAPWLAALAAALTAALVWKRGAVSRFIRPAVRKLPVIGRLPGRVLLARFSFLMATMLKSGITVRDAVSIAMESFPGRKRELETFREDLSQGRGMAESLGRLSFMGEAERSLVLAGEESGSVPESFADIGKTASEDLASDIRTALKILEPVLILAIGVVVGFVVVGMLLPILEMDVLAET